MAMMEPFQPHPKTEETIAAADPGRGAPQPAEGTGPDAEGEVPPEPAHDDVGDQER